MIHLKFLDDLLVALAAGDSLGSTSEFVAQGDIPALFERLRPSGWPFKQVGGGYFSWPAGAPTDDTHMALAIVRSAIKCGEFRGEDVAQRFVAWIDSAPRDAGMTTRKTLAGIRDGQPWQRGALVSEHISVASSKRSIILSRLSNAGDF